MADILHGNLWVHGFFEGSLRGIDTHYMGKASLQQLYFITDAAGYQAYWDIA